MRLCPTLFLPMALAACAQEAGPYPSLAPRPVEKVTFDEPVRPVAAPTANPGLDAEIAARSADLAKVTAGFEAAATAARRDAARAEHQPVGSDAWLDAQGALARLDDWRSQTSALTAAIEALASDQAAQLKPAYPALDVLAARAAAESDRQASVVEALQRQLPAA